MTPREFEEAVAAHFRSLGFTTEVTPLSNDYGIDVFACRGHEKIAVQAKMYGSTRRVNREMVMQLHGAKDFFDCTKAVLATDGELTSDAARVAAKLGIEILKIGRLLASPPTAQSSDMPSFEGTMTASAFFERVWQTQIMPLAGTTLSAEDGRSNRIVRVDWTGVLRVSSTGKEQFIPLEVFRRAVHRVVETGCVTRAQINDDFAKRASSGVVLILAQIKEFEHLSAPSRLVLRSR